MCSAASASGRPGVVSSRDLYVFGGAAMALAYDARRSTHDIDAVFQPHGIVLDEAGAVADELGLPRWWLIEQAIAYGASTPGLRGRLRRWMTGRLGCWQLAACVEAPSPQWLRAPCPPSRCDRHRPPETSADEVSGRDRS